MRNFIVVSLLLLSLGGCIRKIDIQQGNILALGPTQQLKLGMTKAEVEKILGTPILLNTFNQQRVDYVYTFKPGNAPMTEKYLSLTFSEGHLKQIGRFS